MMETCCIGDKLMQQSNARNERSILAARNGLVVGGCCLVGAGCWFTLAAIAEVAVDGRSKAR